jgi:vacuolar-type H+-ATPase subunit I/STV1
MSNAGLEKLAWVLLYSGLLLLAFGLFLQRSHELLGWVLAVGGAVDAALGAFVIWLRSRRNDSP